MKNLHLHSVTGVEPPPPSLIRYFQEIWNLLFMPPQQYGPKLCFTIKSEYVERRVLRFELNRSLHNC